MQKLGVLCVSLTIACLIPFASASGYLIDSPADSALVGVQHIDFDGQTLGQYNSLTIGNVTFTPSLSSIAQKFNQYPPTGWTDNLYSAHLHVSDTYTGGPPYNTSGRYLDNGGYSDHAGGDILTISFATPTSAFAFSWGAADMIWTLTAYDASDNVIESSSLPTHHTDTKYFYGIANDNIKYLVLENTHVTYYGDKDSSPDVIFIDYPSNPVPVPPAVLLLGSGLLGLVGYRRLRKG